MAKTKKHHKRRKSSLSSGVTVRRRRRRASSKGFLSELFNPTIAMNSAKGLMSSATGALGAVVTNKVIMPTAGKGPKILTALVAGFLASSFGMPNLGSGYAGGMLALTFQNGLMGDGDETHFADEGSLSDMPLFLDEDGQPMVLMEGGPGESPYYRYLNDNELAEIEEGELMEMEEMDED